MLKMAKKVWLFKGSSAFMKAFGNIVFNHFLSRFIKHNRYYYVRPGKLTDLQKFCKECMNEEELENKGFVENWNTEDYDKLAVDVLRYVHNLLTYKSDSSVWNVTEYWQRASKTLELRTGDCEDGAILILTLCRLNGIPANRVYLDAGWVAYKGKRVGHAYITYIGNEGTEYILDWCYYYDNRRIPNRKTFMDDERYQDRWFFGNDGGFYK